MKEFYETGFRDEILLAEKYRPWELALVDVSADRSDVLMKEFSDLLGGIEIDFGSHSSPMSFWIL